MGVILATMLTACSGGISSLNPFARRPTPQVPADVSPRVQAALRDFDFAVQSLRALYLKPEAVGADWQKAVDVERNRIIKSEDEAQFIESLNQVITELKDDDVALLPPPAPTSAVTTTYSGIGILVGMPEQEKDRLLVLSVYADSPADRAGLKAHDAIIAIEGEPITFESRNTILAKLRGEAGSKVKVTVRTPGQAPREVTLTRRPVVPASPATYKHLPDTNVGYIAPDPTHVEAMRTDTANAMRELSTERNLDSLVLDLRIIRSNEFPLNNMLSLFVNGQVGTLQTRARAEKIDIAGKSIAGSQEIPLAILVGDQTSGQAEAFAGLLQDLGRAKIVGVPTQGNVAQTTTVTLPASRVRLQIPSGDYVGVKNNRWSERGVTPDVLSEAEWEEFTDEEDPQLKQAVEAL
jgi:carboxyl-terminal processing protease